MHFESLAATLAPSPARRLLSVVSIACLALVLLSPATFAQVASGSIAGRVSDAATGKSLQGAIVKLSGTHDVAYTNAAGRFTMSGIPARNHQLTVEYVGLDPCTHRVTLAPGQSASVYPALEGAVLKLSLRF